MIDVDVVDFRFRRDLPEFPMEVQSARFVFFFVMSAAVCVWTHSLIRALKLGRQEQKPEDPWSPAFNEQPTDDANLYTETGMRTVRGNPERLSKALAHAMLHQSVPGSFSGLFELVQRTADRVVIRKAAPMVCNQPPGLYFTEVEFYLEPIADDVVEVSYVINYERLLRRLRRTALAIILGAGLPVLVGLGGVIWYFVVSNGNPGVRWQVLQTLQVVHVLWPPFLIMHRHKAGREQARTYLSNMLISLELSTDTTDT